MHIGAKKYVVTVNIIFVSSSYKWLAVSILPDMAIFHGLLLRRNYPLLESVSH
jgi:hypothetical protein